MEKLGNVFLQGEHRRFDVPTLKKLIALILGAVENIIGRTFSDTTNTCRANIS